MLTNTPSRTTLGAFHRSKLGEFARVRYHMALIFVNESKSKIAAVTQAEFNAGWDFQGGNNSYLITDAVATGEANWDADLALYEGRKTYAQGVWTGGIQYLPVLVVLKDGAETVTANCKPTSRDFPDDVLVIEKDTIPVSLADLKEIYREAKGVFCAKPYTLQLCVDTSYSMYSYRVWGSTPPDSSTHYLINEYDNFVDWLENDEEIEIVYHTATPVIDFIYLNEDAIRQYMVSNERWLYSAYSILNRRISNIETNIIDY